ncbi:glutamine methyltransferase [Tamlana sedimentorum]|uniref:peptide chain release factor N(5)-glutamine methyltransferase n=1 Tax=Neotamlana sedimentorum TaxID=1435349 RepID=A0A0D7W8X1_9FLAO|nr:peptide chain release factor N(5)-glutamine methyltransferase [Tamlana sedimentorum]KJD35595.1 glutamine methyltransferase [Tamlana sedimentorum]
MKLKPIQHTFLRRLAAFYSSEEINAFYYELIEFYFGISRINLALNPDVEVDDASKLNESLKDLEAQKPIQYIIGETEFYGLKLKVSQSVLIPRPETEELISWIINDCKEASAKINILDIGTGSGCIAISLAKNLPNAKVYALDVSAEALKIAKQNAELNHVDIEFIEDSILDIKNLKLLSEDLKFDVIVSNPPYIRNLEKELMKPNVLENEPHLALFVDNNNPLIFYKAITNFAVDKLYKNGSLFFEINEYLGQDMKALLNLNFNKVELKKDIFEKDRMIKGVLK